MTWYISMPWNSSVIKQHPSFNYALKRLIVWPLLLLIPDEIQINNLRELNQIYKAYISSGRAEIHHQYSRYKQLDEC